MFVSQTLKRRKSLCRDDRPQHKAATSGQEAYVNKQYKGVELSKSKVPNERALAQERGKLFLVCQWRFVFFVRSTPFLIGSVYSDEREAFDTVSTLMGTQGMMVERELLSRVNLLMRDWT